MTPQAPMWDAVIAGASAGLIVIFVAAILWGAASYWVDVICRNRVRVRPWK